MKLKTIRNDDIVENIKRVIPNAVVVVKDGSLNKLSVGNVHIVISSYTIDVAIEEVPMVWRATASVGGEVVVFTESKEEDVKTRVENFCNAAHLETSLFTVEEVPAS